MAGQESTDATMTEQNSPAKPEPTPAESEPVPQDVKPKTDALEPKEETTPAGKDDANQSDSSSDETDDGPEPEWKLRRAQMPVTGKVLANLVKAQQALQPVTRETVIQSIVECTLARKTGLENASSRYILKRLINGVSTSVGFARPNYATMLMRITKAHAVGSGVSAVDAIAGAVCAVYGPDGSYDDRHARAQLERTLGTLAAVSAVVRGARKTQISLATSRSFIRMLRAAVSGVAMKWNLTPAVVDVLQELLANERRSGNLQQLMKMLWSWAEDRASMHDGLTVALLLLVEYEAIEAKVFEKLYPTLEDLSVPLMKMFETGFPVSQGENPETELDEVPDVFPDLSGIPTAWALTVRYFNTSSAKEHFGGISAFWKEIVVPKLMFRVKCVEKNLVGALMLPSSLACLTEGEDFDEILSRQVRSTIVKLKRLTAKPPGNELYGQTRDGTIAKRIGDALKNLHEILQTVDQHSKLSDRGKTEIAARIVQWALEKSRGGNLESDLIVRSVPKNIPEESLPLFFATMAFHFLRPPKQAGEMMATRASYLKCLESAASGYRSLVVPFMQLTINAAICEKQTPSLKEKTARRLSAQAFSARMEKVAAEMTSKGTCSSLPSPEPTIDEAYRGNCYNSLIDCVLGAGNCDEVFGRLEIAVEIINTTEGIIEASPLLQPIDAALERLSNGEASALQKCMLTVGGFLKITGHFIPTTAGADFEKSISLLTDCVQSLFEKSEGKGDETPSILEQTTHMLCFLSVGTKKSGLIAKCALEQIGAEIDDTVSAVMFDLLEKATKGVWEMDDANAEDESDNDSVIAMSVESRSDIDDVIDEEGDGKGESGTGSTIENGKPEDGSKPGKDEGGDEEEDVLDADVDPDTEDPKTLAAFDKHLGNHMKLLQNEKKKAKEESREAEERIRKLLEFIGSACNLMRLRLGKSEEGGEKQIAVFFDMFIRCHEAVLSTEYDGSTHAAAVSKICLKHMKNKEITNGLNDMSLVGDFSNRLFTCICSFRGGRGVVSALDQSLNRCVRTIMGILKKKGEGYDSVITWYSELWEKYLKGKMMHISGSLFTLLGEFTPAEVLKLGGRAQEVLTNEKAGLPERRRAMQCLNSLTSTAVRLHGENEASAKGFWDMVNELGESLNDKESERWKDEAILKQFVQIIRAGESAGTITKFYSQTIFQIANADKKYGQLQRMMKGMKRQRDEDGKTVKRRKKIAKRLPRMVV